MTRRKLARNTKCHEGSWLETQDYNEEAGYKHRMTRRKLARNKEWQLETGVETQNVKGEAG
jgi:hypothetical protein